MAIREGPSSPASGTQRAATEGRLVFIGLRAAAAAEISSSPPSTLRPCRPARRRPDLL
ncbi:hypothetical protein TRIUR3_01267 [Triticum urartu]|uniref:Uncharacterized protein n=1 Tax=Triticum urartu TaxID=4572 RepID=M7ZYE6_TRIUA|nr:hypothetical protein TRIUR3_01267 [Triticum urartu]